jgi:hypothetical protein
LALAACLIVQPAAAEPRTYVNERFGTSVTFPAEIFVDHEEPPANGDGLTFISRDGASLAVFGMYNSLDDTPASLADRLSTDNGPSYKLTYRRVGDDWIVLSGRDEGLVFYDRYEFSRDDIIHGMSLRYPVDLKLRYDRLASEIAATLSGP